MTSGCSWVLTAGVLWVVEEGKHWSQNGDLCGPRGLRLGRGIWFIRQEKGLESGGLGQQLH